MFFEHREFGGDHGLPESWDDSVFSSCTFDGLGVEGLSVDGAMLWCTVRRSEFYWGLFNTAALVNVRFQDCRFPGTSFRGCRMVECTFEHCRFVLDNLGGTCTVDDCILADCVFDNCRFDHKAGERQSVFTPDNRIYGCSQRNTIGLDGVAQIKPGKPSSRGRGPS